MNHIVKRIGILTGVFAAALCVFFWRITDGTAAETKAVYMDMEAASLPSITVQMLGRDMNRLYGYRQEMNTTAAGESDDPSGGSCTDGGYYRRRSYGISYEVRSMDRERPWSAQRCRTGSRPSRELQLPAGFRIFLTKEREYQLIIQLDTENYGSVYYYTEDPLDRFCAACRDMVDLAADFSIKTFDYEQAKKPDHIS